MRGPAVRHIAGVLGVSAPVTSKLYDVLLLTHVLLALASVAVVAAAAWNAAEASRLVGLLDDEELPPGLAARVERLRRFYRPGRNLAGRVLFLVPVLGLALVADSGGLSMFSQPWLAGGVAAWLLAATVAEGALWPADRHLRAVIGATKPPAKTLAEGAPAQLGTQVRRGADRRVVRATAQQAQVAAATVELALVVAFVLMIGQPGVR